MVAVLAVCSVPAASPNVGLPGTKGGPKKDPHKNRKPMQPIDPRDIRALALEMAGESREADKLRKCGLPIPPVRQIACKSRWCPHCGRLEQARLARKSAAKIRTMGDPVLVLFSVSSGGFNDLGTALGLLRAGMSRVRRTWAFKVVQSGTGAIEVKLLGKRRWLAHAHVVLDVRDDDLDLWEHEAQAAFAKATDGRGRFSVNWDAPDVAPDRAVAVAKYAHKRMIRDDPWWGDSQALSVAVRALRGRRLPVTWG